MFRKVREIRTVDGKDGCLLTLQPYKCGGLLVFAQGTNRVKNAEIFERRGFRRFFVSGKVTPAFSQNRAGMRGFLLKADGIGNFLKLF